MSILSLRIVRRLFLTAEKVQLCFNVFLKKYVMNFVYKNEPFVLSYMTWR